MLIWQIIMSVGRGDSFNLDRRIILIELMVPGESGIDYEEIDYLKVVKFWICLNPSREIGMNKYLMCIIKHHQKPRLE